MCGIAGMLAFDRGDTRVTAAVVTAMRECVAHRGPNGGSTWVDDAGRIGLGHRRLSIIDLADQANQPMANEDGSLRIIFNGEIYNHAELRRELSQTGRHHWLTDHSDTEVILHGFEEWGIDVLTRLRGMFAFALWDARAKALWLVRDRVGVKPLYYSLDDNRVTFASEIKALLAVPGQRRAVHEESLFHYLSFLTTPGTQTLFDGVQKMAPGTWLRIDSDGQVTQRRYWDAWDAARPIDGTDEELGERILAKLRESVRLRKVSDVPVGVFLSGGVDSSTNAALFAEGESRPVRTFSIGYDRDYSGYANELHHARAMAERIHSEHHERRLTRDDVIEFLPRMVHLQDEPIADPVCVPVYYVAKLARDSRHHRLPVGRRRRRTVHRLPELAAGARASTPGRFAGTAIPQGPRGIGAERRGLWPRMASRVPAPRLARRAVVLGRRGVFSRCGKAATAQSAFTRSVSRADIVGRARADSRRLSGEGA